MSHHDGVTGVDARNILRHATLWDVEPVVFAIIEDSTVGDAYPAVAFAEFIGMGHYGQCIGTGGHVFAVNAYVGTSDALRTDYTGVVGHVKGVVGQEEVVVAITVNNFWTFTGLPAVTCLAGGD